MEQENKMGTMNIWKLILSMSGPAMLSMLVHACYNIIDSIFIARLGESALTSLSLAFPVQMLVISVGIGTATGVNSLIARRLGSRNYEQANKAASIGLKLSVINWIGFLIFGLFFAKKYIGLFSDNPDVLIGGATYLSIITIFSISISISIIIERIFQATGNMTIPMITIITGALCNTILDPILIFGLLGFPKLGIAGAAIATVFSEFVGMILGVVFLMKKKIDVKIDLKTEFDKETLKEIYIVAGPSIVMQSIGSIMTFGLNGILSTYSETAVAVMGVYFKLQSFIFMPVFGVNQGVMPVIGYNFGAKKKERLIGAFKASLIICFIIMGIGVIIFMFFTKYLLALFNASDNMYSIGIPALRIISLCFIPAAFSIICSSATQAVGHGVITMVGSILRQLVIILPLAFILGKIGGVQMIWWSIPAAEIFTVNYYIYMIRRLYKNEIENL